MQWPCQGYELFMLYELYIQLQVACVRMFDAASSPSQ